MGKLKVLLATGVSLLCISIQAQETNALPIYTQIEAFELQVDTVIVKASSLIGTVTAKTGSLSVTCKESQNVATGQKLYGLAIAVRFGTAPEDVTIVDYDEINAFINAIEFLSKADSQLTMLSTFHANFTTKAGLKLSSYTSSKRPGTIQAALQSNRLLKSRILLEPDQLERFKFVMQQALNKLDELQHQSP